jgi:hypothetical protein
LQTPATSPAADNTACTITFQINACSLDGYTDEYLAQLWHISQANPAAFGDKAACEFAERVGREIIRRFVTTQPPALWTHQGRHVAAQAQIVARAAVDDAPEPAAAATSALTPPAIGQYWYGQGGIYLGVCDGEAGQPRQHLIVANDPNACFQSVWGKYGEDVAGAKQQFDGRANTLAMAAAGCEIAHKVLALEIDGHRDFFIPAREQLRHAYQATPDAFVKEGWHWSSTQNSRHDAFAQDFEGGGSDWNYKGNEFRVRAFRGLPLDHLNTSKGDTQ